VNTNGKGIANYYACLDKARREGPVVPSSIKGRKVPKCDREYLAQKLLHAAKRNPDLARAAVNMARVAVGL